MWDMLDSDEVKGSSALFVLLARYNALMLYDEVQSDRGINSILSPTKCLWCMLVIAAMFLLCRSMNMDSTSL